MVAGSTRLKLMRGIAVAVMLCAAVVVPASAQDITDKMKSWIFGPPAVDKNPNADPNTPKEIDCPGVEVRNGAGDLALSH